MVDEPFHRSTSTPTPYIHYPSPRVSAITGTDTCFHCHQRDKKCTRIDGGLCRIGRED